MAKKHLEERSLITLRKEGATCDVCQRWIPLDAQWRKKKRRDLFNIFDVVAVRPDFTGVLGLQITSWSNVSARLNKIKTSPEALAWLNRGNQIEIWGWKQKSNKRWEAKRKEVHVYELLCDPF